MPHPYYEISFRMKKYLYESLTSHKKKKKHILLVKERGSYRIDQLFLKNPSFFEVFTITPLCGSHLPISLAIPLIHRKTQHLCFSPTTSMMIPEDFNISILSQFLYLLLNLFFPSYFSYLLPDHILNLILSNN